jgi:hypothetical protein
MRTFTKDTALSEHAGARHGMCELTVLHDRGKAWERNGRGMVTAYYV